MFFVSRKAAPSILVLAEHTFFILDLYGHILVQRRLDHHPSCFWSYPANPTSTSTDAVAAAKGGSASSRGPAAVVQAENLLIATHTKALQVYRGQQLAWAAQLELVPVAVRVTSIAGMRGMIVALDDSGEQRSNQHSFMGLSQHAVGQSLPVEAAAADHVVSHAGTRGLCLHAT
jgi:Bardet-Biedl syndrome 9 protein